MHLQLSYEGISAWKNREGPLVLTTVSPTKVHNSIYASIVNIIAIKRPA